MKFLAVSQNRGDPTPLIAEEGAQMANLVADGLVTTMWLKADYSGAVLILESPDTEQAKAQLATLPLVKAGITDFSVTTIVDPPGAPPN